MLILIIGAHISMTSRPAPSICAPAELRGTLRVAASVVSACRGGDTILLDLAHGRYFTLNDVGGAIWAHLEEGIQLSDLVAQLIAQYDAPPEAITADAVALLTHLRHASLITCGT